MTLIDRKLYLSLSLCDKNRYPTGFVLHAPYDDLCLFCHCFFFSAAPKGPKLFMSPTRAKVGDTVRITVQGFQVGSPGVSAWGVKKKKELFSCE